MITLTKEGLTALNPCGLSDRLKLFDNNRTLNARQALALGVSIPDILWVAGRMGRKDLCVRFALACTQRVSHLNTDKRVRKALDATKAWLDNPTEENRKAAASPAKHPAKAAYAAAYAASYASHAASYASHAASYASHAAASAAYATSSREQEQAAQREIFIRIFCQKEEVTSFHAVLCDILNVKSK